MIFSAMASESFAPSRDPEYYINRGRSSSDLVHKFLSEAGSPPFLLGFGVRGLIKHYIEKVHRVDLVRTMSAARIDIEYMVAEAICYLHSKGLISISMDFGLRSAWFAGGQCATCGSSFDTYGGTEQPLFCCKACAVIGKRSPRISKLVSVFSARMDARRREAFCMTPPSAASQGSVSAATRKVLRSSVRFGDGDITREGASPHITSDFDSAFMLRASRGTLFKYYADGQAIHELMDACEGNSGEVFCPPAAVPPHVHVRSSTLHHKYEIPIVDPRSVQPCIFENAPCAGSYFGLCQMGDDYVDEAHLGKKEDGFSGGGIGMTVIRRRGEFNGLAGVLESNVGAFFGPGIAGIVASVARNAVCIPIVSVVNRGVPQGGVRISASSHWMVVQAACYMHYLIAQDPTLTDTSLTSNFLDADFAQSLGSEFGATPLSGPFERFGTDSRRAMYLFAMNLSCSAHVRYLGMQAVVHATRFVAHANCGAPAWSQTGNAPYFSNILRFLLGPAFSSRISNRSTDGPNPSSIVNTVVMLFRDALLLHSREGDDRIDGVGDGDDCADGCECECECGGGAGCGAGSDHLASLASLATYAATCSRVMDALACCKGYWSLPPIEAIKEAAGSEWMMRSSRSGVSVPFGTSRLENANRLFSHVVRTSSARGVRKPLRKIGAESITAITIYISHCQIEPTSPASRKSPPAAAAAAAADPRGRFSRNLRERGVWRARRVGAGVDVQAVSSAEIVAHTLCLLRGAGKPVTASTMEALGSPDFIRATDLCLLLHTLIDLVAICDFVASTACTAHSAVCSHVYISSAGGAPSSMTEEDVACIAEASGKGAYPAGQIAAATTECLSRAVLDTLRGMSHDEAMMTLQGIVAGRLEARAKLMRMACCVASTINSEFGCMSAVPFAMCVEESELCSAFHTSAASQLGAVARGLMCREGFCDDHPDLLIGNAMAMFHDYCGSNSVLARVGCLFWDFVFASHSASMFASPVLDRLAWECLDAREDAHLTEAAASPFALSMDGDITPYLDNPEHVGAVASHLAEVYGMCDAARQTWLARIVRESGRDPSVVTRHRIQDVRRFPLSLTEMFFAYRIINDPRSPVVGSPRDPQKPLWHHMGAEGVRLFREAAERNGTMAELCEVIVLCPEILRKSHCFDSVYNLRTCTPLQQVVAYLNALDRDGGSGSARFPVPILGFPTGIGFACEDPLSGCSQPGRAAAAAAATPTPTTSKAQAQAHVQSTSNRLLFLAECTAREALMSSSEVTKLIMETLDEEVSEELSRTSPADIVREMDTLASFITAPRSPRRAPEVHPSDFEARRSYVQHVVFMMRRHEAVIRGVLGMDRRHIISYCNRIISGKAEPMFVSPKRQCREVEVGVAGETPPLRWHRNVDNFRMY